MNTTTTANKRVILINKSEDNPILSVAVNDGEKSTPFSGNTQVGIYFGVNRIPGETWKKLENHKVFMDSLKQMESRGEIEFIELSAKEDDEQINTIKDIEKAKKLSRFEFCASRLRRWLASENRPEIAQTLDQNLSFLIESGLENEEREFVARRFVNQLKHFERQNQQQKPNRFTKNQEEW